MQVATGLALVYLAAAARAIRDPRHVFWKQLCLERVFLGVNCYHLLETAGPFDGLLAFSSSPRKHSIASRGKLQGQAARLHVCLEAATASCRLLLVRNSVAGHQEVSRQLPRKRKGSNVVCKVQGCAKCLPGYDR